MNKLCVLFVCLFAIGCGQKDPAAAAPEDAAAKPIVDVKVATVTLGSITERLSVTGSLATMPNEEAKVAPLAAGRVKNVFVKVGDKVSRGQAIATLDPGAAAGQVNQAQALVKVAQATMTQAKVNYAAQTRTQQAAIDQARLNLETQRVALAKLRAGSRPQEVAQAQAAVASAQAALTSAQQNLSRSRTLFSEGLLARKDLEAAQAQEATAKASLDSARQSLSLSKQGNRPEDIRAGELAVKLAEQQQQATMAQQIQIAAKAQDVRIAQGQLAAARGALQSAQAQTHALQIVSPLSGTVVARAANPGESVDVTSSIVTVVNLDRVRLILNVPSVQSSSVAVGQLVTFTTDAEPTVERQAHITVVSKAVDPATNAVQVEAVVENPGNTLRDDGMVKAKIFTATHAHVLLVPAAALVEKDDKTTAFVAGEDNTAKATPVKTGIQDGEKVEVVSGLNAGDKIVTQGAFELDDGTKIKVEK